MMRILVTALSNIFNMFKFKFKYLFHTHVYRYITLIRPFSLNFSCISFGILSAVVLKCASEITVFDNIQTSVHTHLFNNFIADSYPFILLGQSYDH